MKYESLSDAYFDFNRKQLKNEVNFMLNYDLDYQQVLYLKFLFFEEFEELFKYLGFNAKTIKVKEKFTTKQINDLYDKGIVKYRWNKQTHLMPDMNDITDEFLPIIGEVFGIEPNFLNKKKEEVIEQNQFIDIAGEELFDAYPKTNNSGMLLVACNPFTYKNIVYSGKEDVKRLYAELINYDWTKHKSIINKIKQDDGEVCNVKITTFVKDKMWEYIKHDNDGKWTEFV